MILSTVIRVGFVALLVGAAILSGQEKEKEQAIQPPPEKMRTVFAIVKLNGKSKTIKGRRYDLVVMALDPGPTVLAMSGETDFAMLFVNGKNPANRGIPVEPETELKQTSPLKFVYMGIELRWMPLPQKGDLQVVFGATAGGQRSYEQLLARTQPLTVDVKKIPTVAAKTADELIPKLIPLVRKDRPLVKGVYKVNDKTKIIDKQKYSFTVSFGLIGRKCLL